MISSVSGRSERSSLGTEALLDLDVARVGSSSPIWLLGGDERAKPHRKVLYLLKSLCVAFISIPFEVSTFGHTFCLASSE